MAGSFTTAAGILSNFRPLVVALPPPPRLEGPLAPNDWLARAVKFADNMVSGPESMVVRNGYVYTGLADGWIVEVHRSGQSVRRIRRMSIDMCGRPGAPEGACGRPLGIRAGADNYLYVADAYAGILKINPVNGQFQFIVNARYSGVNGKPLRYVNDLAVARDGTIFFTSSSSKYPPSKSHSIILEGERTGRVLKYDPRTRQVVELVTILGFPNGIELSEDESYLLIAEGARAKIHKVNLRPGSTNLNQIETFAENLPGFVNNIRRTPRRSYWLGFLQIRHDGLPSVLDKYGNDTDARAVIMAMPEEQITAQIPKYAIAVELNESGNIIRSLHDPQGKTYHSVSELQEEGDVLYIGSVNRPFIGKLSLSQLGTPNTAAMEGNKTTEKQIADFMELVRQRLATMTEQQVREIVPVLVKKLVDAKLEELAAQGKLAKLQEEINNLMNGSGISTTSASTTQLTNTTTPSNATTNPEIKQAAMTTTSGEMNDTMTGTMMLSNSTLLSSPSDSTAPSTSNSSVADIERLGTL